VRRPILTLATLFVVISLVFLTGCGGGGSPAASQAIGRSPEAALRESLSGWQTGGGPLLPLVSSPVPAVSGSGSYGSITFRDLSNGTWTFDITNIIYFGDDLAEIDTVFTTTYAATDTAKINFTMVRENGEWVIENIEVYLPPAGISTSGGTLQGVVTDALYGSSSPTPVSGALVYISGTSLQAVTDSNGYYEINGIPPGTYQIVITRDGYAPQTFTRTIS